MKTLIYPVMGCIQSCIPGALELQEGEQVTLLLDQEKNANFAESLLGTITQVDVATGTDGWTRRYHIEYDEDELGVGITSIEMCDVLPVPRCFSCCEYLEELIGDISNNRASPLVGSILNSEDPLDIDFSLLSEGDIDDLAPLLECKVAVCAEAPITGDGTAESPLDIAYAGDNTHGVVTLAVPDNYPVNINSETEAVTPAYLLTAVNDILDDGLRQGCEMTLDSLESSACNPAYVVWVQGEDTLNPDQGCLRILSADNLALGQTAYGDTITDVDMTAVAWDIDTLLGGNDTGQGYAPEARVGIMEVTIPDCVGQNYRFEVLSGGQEGQASFYARGFGLVINGVPRVSVLNPDVLVPVGNYSGYQISVISSTLIGTLPTGTYDIYIYWIEHPFNSPSAVLQGYPVRTVFRIVRDI